MSSSPKRPASNATRSAQAASGDTLTLRFGGNYPPVPPNTGTIPPIPAPTVIVPGEALNPLTDPALGLEAFQAQVGQVLRSGAPRMESIAQLTEVLDLFLQGEWTEATQPGKKAGLFSALRQLMGPRGQGNVVMAQINPTIGDLEGNAKKIMAYIDAAEQINADTVIFPELALMGYPVRDIIKRHPFIVEENVKWLKAIAERVGQTRVQFGFVEPRHPEPGQKAQGKEFFNAMAVLGDGKIEKLVRKSLLPTYGEFNDYRTFEPSPASGAQPPETLGQASWGFDTPAESGQPHPIHGRRYGLGICEDGWNNKDFFNRPLYETDPYAQLVANRPEMLVNLSASPTRSRKEQMKHAMLSFVAQQAGIPYVYVNQVGAIEDVSFDGSSRVYDANGQLIARAKSFKEQFMVANPITGEGKVYPLPVGLEKTLGTKRVFNPLDQSDLGRTYETIIQAIRDYFKKTGFEKAVLGMSGGLDSAVVATLLVDALGPQNVVGVSMPYGPITTSQSRKDAVDHAKNLGIQLIEVPITEMVNASWEAIRTGIGAIRSDWEQVAAEKATTFENLQARARATVLWSISNQMKKTLTMATSDKSELYLGYATINGDMSGAYAPIGDVPKTKVRQLARWMNANRPVQNAIPESVITKPPGAELKIDPKTGLPMTAEDDNMPYEFLDEIIWRIENLGQSKAQMANEPFYYETQMQPISAEQKTAWLDKFFWKMPAAVYKWSIFPPSTIVEGNGTINKTEYHHPITANRINWNGHSPQAMAAVLESQLTAKPPAFV